MKTNRRLLALWCLIAPCLFLSVPTTTHSQEDPRRVILFVVDGAGVGIWSLADFQSYDLAVRQFPVVGLVDTRASQGIYPGSASAATAFAIGERSFIGAIGVGPDSQPHPTVLEVAQEQGLATGLVSTARITDATPAAFASHLVRREDEAEVARQMSSKGIDVILGGGRRYFSPPYQPDSLNLLTALRQNNAYVEDAAGLGALNIDTVTSLVGLFYESDMPVYPHRSPSLSEMAEAALAVLDKDPDGFFLLLETESTDTEPHGNVELDVLVQEMADVNDAINVLLEYHRNNPETLIIIAGDHDTGGLTIQPAAANRLLSRAAARMDTTGIRLGEISTLLDSEEQALLDSTRYFMDRLSSRLLGRARELRGEALLVARYTTGSHSANLVPLFAIGPNANSFSGIINNDRIGKLLLEFVGRSER